MLLNSQTSRGFCSVASRLTRVMQTLTALFCPHVDIHNIFTESKYPETFKFNPYIYYCVHNCTYVCNVPYKTWITVFSVIHNYDTPKTNSETTDYIL